MKTFLKTSIVFLLAIIFINSCTRNKEAIELEKLIFHTDEDGCWGPCPEYHLEISDDLQTRLWIEKETYFDTIYHVSDLRNRGDILDSSKLGFYEGKISTDVFQNFKSLVENTRFDTIQNNSRKTDCNDALTKRIILYFKGNIRKEITYSCEENWQLDSISNLVYRFIDEHQLTKTDERFFLEDFKN